jgi:hypothetical protein
MSNKPSNTWLLTTIDNPHNPFSEWALWYQEDLRLGYDTCGLLARLTAASNDINDRSELAAMRDIVMYNFSGNHIMVSETTLEASI